MSYIDGKDTPIAPSSPSGKSQTGSDDKAAIEQRLGVSLDSTLTEKLAVIVLALVAIGCATHYFFGWPG